MRDPQRRVAFAVGDTAGHTYPALALAEAFLNLDADTDLLFLGTSHSIAERLLARAGHRLVPVPGRPIRRAGRAAGLRAIAGVPSAVWSARRTLAAHRSQLVIGFGGFASGGVLIAGRTLGLLTVSHEANVELGLANSWLRGVVHRLYRGLPEPGAADTAVGVPVRAAISDLADLPREPPQGRLRVLVTSGSRGDEFLARRLPEALGLLAELGTRVEVLHQAARADALARAYAAAGVSADVRPFLEDMAAAYRWADVAVARAGASTLAELAIARLPALIVPLADAAADHQTANGRFWQASGAGRTLSEVEWDAHGVAAWFHDLASEPAGWRRAAEASRRLARPDAGRRLAEECARLASGLWRPSDRH